MKAAFVFVCVCLGVAAAALTPSPVRANARGIPSAAAARIAKLVHFGSRAEPKDTVQFLEGFALGLASDFGNVTECANDSSTVVDDFDKAYQEIKNGISHLNVAEVAQGLVDFGSGVQEIAKALEECGDAQLVADIANLGKYLSEGPAGILQLIAKEILNFYSDEKTLGYDYRQAIKAWDASPRDYHSAGFYTGEITGIFLNIQ